MNIAFVAHDGKKKLMENLCTAYRHILTKHTLFSTGTTGQAIEDATNLTVTKYLAGHLGGVEQLCAQLALNELDVIIFLRDSSFGMGYDSEHYSLVRLADMHNIPLATNLATAEALLLSLDRGDLNWRLNMRR